MVIRMAFPCLGLSLPRSMAALPEGGNPLASRRAGRHIRRGRLARDVSLANRVRSGRKQP
ncbi:protein of unknown function [Methylorubrum extorquens]|uniref:Uncharacterized protein n=1 Tax=Methylorubrum extorquens TaxID=408 RepID=A0A2N9AU20_METEX|nr:protein of unknown function [Methylorubrum extorquens]